MGAVTYYCDTPKSVAGCCSWTRTAAKNLRRTPAAQFSLGHNLEILLYLCSLAACYHRPTALPRHWRNCKPDCTSICCSAQQSALASLVLAEINGNRLDAWWLFWARFMDLPSLLLITSPLLYIDMGIKEYRLSHLWWILADSLWHSIDHSIPVLFV